MVQNMADVVYILKNGIKGNELRYSLRSLKNFPHDKVWFFGGKPEGLKPDVQVELEQHGVMTWEKTRWTIEQVCLTKGVSDDFWLFNDDFFIMKPIEEWTPKFDKTLYRRVQQIKGGREGLGSLYSEQLDRTRELLLMERLRSNNYEVHMPMLINKRKALAVIRKYPKCVMFRSLYGNYYKIGGEQMADCKISSLYREPKADAVMLSTNDVSFKDGKVGEYIRAEFTEKCEYEL